MEKRYFRIGEVPCCVWGEKSDAVYLFVHGKMSDKESAAKFSEIANRRGFQVLSFDLPEHGERQGTPRRCDVWNGVEDLRAVEGYAREHWTRMRLFACSLGAYFSLMAFPEILFDQCLLQSPIVDMEYLIQQMFVWFGISEDELREKREIPTTMDTLSWRYYSYVKENPVSRWRSPTEILYGEKDSMQSQEVIQRFAEKCRSCRVTVGEGCEHAFMTEPEEIILSTWLEERIGK